MHEVVQQVVDRLRPEESGEVTLDRLRGLLFGDFLDPSVATESRKYVELTNVVSVVLALEEYLAVGVRRRAGCGGGARPC